MQDFQRYQHRFLADPIKKEELVKIASKIEAEQCLILKGKEYKLPTKKEILNLIEDLEMIKARSVTSTAIAIRQGMFSKDNLEMKREDCRVKGEEIFMK